MTLNRAQVLHLALLAAIVCVLGLAAPASAATSSAKRYVTIPAEDRFTPFVQIVHVGDTVEWVNNDTDDHTVVSNDVFNSAGNKGTNVVVSGTDSNNGKPGTFKLQFLRAGSFVYYCRFHSSLDADNQPKAPGPNGGIQDANGNYGTPMNGIITVLPAD